MNSAIVCLKQKEKGSDFHKLIKEVEGWDIKKWKKIYPNFYKWLMKNGFRYNKELDLNLKNKNKLESKKVEGVKK